MKVKSELDFIKLEAWQQKVYNTIRINMKLDNLTPYQKLKSLDYSTPQEFCLFSTLILNRLVNLKEILNSSSKSVQEHLNYDPLQKNNKYKDPVQKLSDRTIFARGNV